MVDNPIVTDTKRDLTIPGLVVKAPITPKMSQATRKPQPTLKETSSLLFNGHKSDDSQNGLLLGKQGSFNTYVTPKSF